MINTGKVKNRRQVRFENFGEALRDATALAEAERAGRLQTLGNWTLGQTLGHLAFWANAPFDGYPTMPTPPWIMRAVLPWFKNWFLNHRLPAGVKIAGTPEGTFGVERLSTDDALPLLNRSFERMAAQMPPLANPVFGAMSHEDWIKLNLRHAELHLSFFAAG